MKHWTNTSGDNSSSPHIGTLPQPDPRWNERNFGLMGRQILAGGWSVFPQTYDGKREPGTPKGDREIQYKKRYRLHVQLPPTDLVEYWCKNDGTLFLNVAGVTGDTAGDGLGWISLDCDIYDRAKIEVIRDIAARTIGRSPLRRGRASVAKEAWIYRRPTGALALPTRRFVLEGLFEGKEEVIEIQDDGLPITFFGRHHGTGVFFLWPERSPYNSSPDCAPVADEGQFAEFLRQVHAIYPIKNFETIFAGKGMVVADVDYLDTDVSDLRVPAIAAASNPAEKPVATAKAKPAAVKEV